MNSSNENSCSNENNIMNVRKKDRDFIRNILTLDSDMILLVKGIVIGLQLQKK